MAGDISEVNTRCTEMLRALQDAIIDYSTPPEKVLIRDLTAKINSYVSFISECRPLSISMGNAIRFVKSHIAKLPLSYTDAEAKASLCSDIDRFINEKIIIADKVIVGHATTKIRDGDVLLTYGLSCVVEMILLSAHELGKKFRVVVVDSRPKFESQALLARLMAKGLSCTYTHINAVSYIMHEVTKVFLGASAVLSNGTVLSRIGTACIAMVAHEFRVPVLICCEAFKFHERVLLDSICCNEIGKFDHQLVNVELSSSVKQKCIPILKPLLATKFNILKITCRRPRCCCYSSWKNGYQLSGQLDKQRKFAAFEFDVRFIYFIM
jgi:translation initiation factor eIF-2B subunit delta